MISSTQLNLQEALSSHSVEYRKTYLSALAAVLFRGDSSICQHLRQSPPHQEPVLPDCVSLLLGDLEDQRYGSEFLSEALFATGLLLSQWPDSRFGCFYISTQFYSQSLPSLMIILIYVFVSLITPALKRWCCILENYRTPESPEVLRMACAEALCVPGVSLSLREHSRAFMSRSDPVTSVRHNRMWADIGKKKKNNNLVGAG